MSRKLQSPFTVVTDTREQLPYAFADIPADADEGGDGGSATLHVPTMRLALPVGDYSILGAPQVVVERKSKEDLYGSVSTTKARDNFEGRLRRMCDDYAFALVLVESEWSDLLGSPPAFTKFAPKALFRTILSWQQRYPLVHWLLLPGRELAEIACYRVLDRFWAEAARDRVELEKLAANDAARGIQRVGGLGRLDELAAGPAREGREVAAMVDAVRAAETGATTR
jgi:hypothetical protein